MSFNHSSNIIISGGVFLNQSTLSQRTGFERLAERAVLSATHDSGESFDRPKCLENTRVAILKRLTDWVLGDTESEPIMWLYGDAGAGKSAIAQTLAETFAREKRLLGSFFFSRNHAQRAIHNPLVATFAYHAATTIPELAEPIISAVDRDPRIFDKTLQTQLTTLIIDPLNTIKDRSSPPGPSIPHFLIIDGLDECSDRRIHCHLLEVLSEAVRKCSHPLKVLVGSRPETEILSTFNSHALHEVSRRLALDSSEIQSHSDIRFFLMSTFQDTKAVHPLKSFIPESWPSDDVVEQLVQKSSGNFIYASTVAKYISSKRHQPEERLKIVLGLRSPSSDNDLPFAELDTLYRYIYSTIPKENLDTVLFILGLLTLQPPNETLGHDSDFSFNKMWSIASFLSLKPGGLEFLLGDLSSVLKWDNRAMYSANAIRITHASVTDFLLDPQRSKEFHISPQKFYTHMTLLCFQHLNAGTGIPDNAYQSGSYHNSQEHKTMCYSFENFSSLLARASMTEELQEEFSRFSLMSALQWFWLRQCSSWHNSHYPFGIALQFICLLEDLPNAQALFSHHQKEFDGCLHLILQKYSSGHKFLAITTLIGLTHPVSGRPDTHWQVPLSPNAVELGRLIFPEYPEHIPLDFTGFVCDSHRDFYLLQWLGISTRSQKHVHAMLKFFSDTSRSKDYALSGMRYATVTFACLTNICQEKIYKAFRRKYTFELANPSEKDHRIVDIGCAYLPQLLARSTASSELITFLRGGHFERKFANSDWNHPEEERFCNFTMEELIPNVMKAIQHYLELYDPIDNIPNNSEKPAPPVSDTQIPSSNTTLPGPVEASAAEDLPVSAVNTSPTVPVYDEVLEGHPKVDPITTNNQATKASKRVSRIRRFFGRFT